ncbi:MAG: hypothetical protein WDW38_006673 [Sanguina aurantia]
MPPPARAQAFAERDDAVADQQHIAGPRRATGAIDHQPLFEQHAGVHDAALPPLPLPIPPPSQLCSGCVVASMPWRWKASRACCSRCMAGSPRH